MIVLLRRIGLGRNVVDAGAMVLVVVVVLALALAVVWPKPWCISGTMCIRNDSKLWYIKASDC